MIDPRTGFYGGLGGQQQAGLASGLGGLAAQAAMGSIGFGGVTCIGNAFSDSVRGIRISSREKTLREELQVETDEWLGDL